MAAIPGTTDSSVWTFKIEVTENSISVANNSSNVTVSVYIGRGSGNSWMYGGTIDGSISVSGFQNRQISCDISKNKITMNSGTWFHVASEQYDIPHNNDGTKTITVAATCGRSMGSPSSCSASGSVTLTTIARASSVSMSGSTIGSEATITINRSDSTFRHTLEYTFGIQNGICTNSSGEKAEFIEGSSFKWLIPSSLANEIPNSTSGTGTLTCTTYSADKKTKIGEKTLSITLSFLKQPTISLSDTPILISNLSEKIDAWGICLAGHSSINIQATATAYDGATIKSVTVSIGGHGSTVITVTENVSSYKINYPSDILTSVGTKNVKLSVTDSRGVTSGFVNVGSVEVYKYSDPVIKTFTVGRKDGEQSTVTAKCSWEIASIKKTNGDGSELNSSIGVIHYKEGKNGTYNPIKDSDGNIISIENGIETRLPIAFDETKSYYFKLIVTDLIEQKDEKEAFISTREVLMDFRAGGKGLSIGKISEADIFEIAMDSQFDNVTTFKEQIIEEYGHYTHLTLASYGSEGYARIARMTVESAWDDAYLVFDVMQRHHTFSTYYISFNHVEHTNPNIANFTYEGDMLGYLVKVAESTWDLFVKKKEKNDFICVVDFKNNPYTKGKTNVEWMMGCETELPKQMDGSDALVSTKRIRSIATDLWNGGASGAFMKENQVITLSEPISKQERGIMLVFSQYDLDNDKALDHDFISILVPKETVAAYPGKGHTFQLAACNFTVIATKYLIIDNNTIKGDDRNEASGTIGTSGISFRNNKFVLRRVYGV